MIHVLSCEQKRDKNGKNYHLLSLYSPECLVKQKNSSQALVRKSKRCGYVAYPVDYTKFQGHDPGASLREGDKLVGTIVTKKVQPYISGSGDLCNTCTVPVFCSEEDPIEFQLAMEDAILRAGKILEGGQLKYGNPKAVHKENKVPETCLIVKTLKS